MEGVSPDDGILGISQYCCREGIFGRTVDYALCKLHFPLRNGFLNKTYLRKTTRDFSTVPPEEYSQSYILSSQDPPLKLPLLYLLYLLLANTFKLKFVFAEFIRPSFFSQGTRSQIEKCTFICFVLINFI